MTPQELQSTIDIKTASIERGALNLPKKLHQLRLRWLGQAGFALTYQRLNLLLDPYLSDSLAHKYAGREFPHRRMMPTPVVPNSVKQLDWLLCTHRHSDHMDPQTLPTILANNPHARLVVPIAELHHVQQIGIVSQQVVPVDAGDLVDLCDHVSLEAIPSAHENLKTDSQGRHHYLGYILRFDDLTIYHSGDCVPYPGLENFLAQKHVDLALLPVNGRDEFRRQRGVPGNFTFEEAHQLCLNADIPAMICHHFGMFDFNTIPLEQLTRKAAAASNQNFNCLVPTIDNVYEIDKKTYRPSVLTNVSF